MTVSDEDYDQALAVLMDDCLRPRQALDGLIDLGWRLVIRSDQTTLTDKDMTND